jgi:hypothetical protein
MKTKSEIRVTLSDELFDCLRAEARELRVPLKWLVANLVCDTIESRREALGNQPAPQAV